MDLNGARQFVSVVNHGSFRKAARALGLPTSTLSDRIVALERELGVALFVRTTRHLVTTDAGNELYESCADAVTTLHEAGERLSGRSATASGTLRITAPPDFAEPELAAAVRAYRARYPGVRVETYLTNRFVNLVTERFDIAIRGGHLRDSGLVARRLGAGTMVLVASPAYVASAPPLRHPKDLARHPCIGFEGDTIERGAASWKLRSEGGSRCHARPKLAVTSTSLAVVLQHAVHGEGVALVPSYHVRQPILEGALMRVLPRWDTAAIPVHVVVPALRVPSSRTKEMVALLVAHLGPLVADA